MKKKKDILIVAVLFGCLVIAYLLIDVKRSQDFTNEMFPLWDGSEFMLIPPYESDVACVIQYEPMQIERKGKKVETREPSWNYTIKTYSDKDVLRQIFNCLNVPEVPSRSIIDAERCLAVVYISRKLNSQSTIRIPFRLDDDGYAITPRGKDRTLYKILKGGLEEWNAGHAAQRERDRAQALLSGYMQSVEKRLRETLSENEYMAIIKDPLPFSTEEFKAFLIKQNEDPDAILSTLQAFYRDHNLILEEIPYPAAILRDIPQASDSNDLKAPSPENR